MFDGIVLLDLISGFATNRTKANMNPPMLKNGLTVFFLDDDLHFLENHLAAT